MKVIVQKFGGTSMATGDSRREVIKKISQVKKDGCQVVVVVSAMGRTGDPYATDTLVDLVRKTNSGLNKRDLDLIMSCGEIISGVVLVAELERAGFPAVCLTGPQAGIVTDGNHGNARVLEVDPHEVQKFLQEGRIVVVTGFQGKDADGLVTTLGRGGSDTTAAALGVSLGAEVVEIYTDVDGVKTADPRMVGDARTLERVTYNELCQLAHEGAKVIHPRAVEIAMQKGIPLRVRNTFTDNPGTLVAAGDTNYENSTKIRDNLITGITYISNISQIRVPLVKEEDMALSVFTVMAKEGISVDFIYVSPKEVIFTVSDDAVDMAVDTLEAIGLKPVLRKDCAKVAAVGAAMTGVPGVMAKIVTALTESGIQIIQSSDSYTSIWCLVDRTDLQEAVRALHRQFNLHEGVHREAG
ncbi:aspartate kinase [Metallumcola ferriviriculae]|uniref:Aspartokinase n=1 Tax=Metallumcola ferriviriculae TaxID=3039180 RepID=A0AAU0UQ55_9FIRM|nr:aspartate kinase [Desulfitibacteraceae bacterium MK1]